MNAAGRGTQILAGVCAAMVSSGPMKSYLMTTGSLFALVAVAHLLRTIAEWSRMPDPGFLLEGPGLGLIAAALSIWAWRLFRASAGARATT